MFDRYLFTLPKARLIVSSELGPVPSTPFSALARRTSLSSTKTSFPFSFATKIFGSWPAIISGISLTLPDESKTRRVGMRSRIRPKPRVLSGFARSNPINA